MFSKTDRKGLLENSKVFEYLNKKQLLRLIFWEWFNKKRITVFYNSLDIGKSAIFAYKDAESMK